MTDESKQNWDTATWEGNRKTQLRASLKLSAKERFEALEELADRYHQNPPRPSCARAETIAAPGCQRRPRTTQRLRLQSR